MDKEFIEISDIVYGIKEQITDGEYMAVMDKINLIRTKYNEDIAGQNICKCISGKINFCTSSIESFMTCKNLQHTLIKFPMLRNQLILYSLPNYNLEELYKYNHNQFFKSDLQLEQINIYELSENKEYIEYSKLLLTLSTNIKGQKQTIFMTIVLYDYIFKNFGFTILHHKYMHTIYNKLNEFILESNTDTAKPIIELIKKLYNIHNNPYIIFQNTIKPYYQKTLVNIQLKRIVNERLPLGQYFTPRSLIHPNLIAILQQCIIIRPSTKNRRRIQEDAQMQLAVTQEIIQESGYPLRNRIQRKLNQNKR